MAQSHVPAPTQMQSPHVALAKLELPMGCGALMWTLQFNGIDVNFCQS